FDAARPLRNLNIDLAGVLISPPAFDGVNFDAVFVPASHAYVAAGVVDGDHSALRQVVGLMQVARLPRRLRRRKARFVEGRRRRSKKGKKGKKGKKDAQSSSIFHMAYVH